MRPCPLLLSAALASGCAAHLQPPRMPLVATAVHSFPAAPAPGPSASLPLPSIEGWREDNGLEVRVLNRPGGIVTATVALPGLAVGNDVEAAARVFVLTQLLDGRGLPRDPGSLALAADEAGLRIEINTTEVGTLASITTQPRDAALALRWLEHAVAHPAIDQTREVAAQMVAIEHMRQSSSSVFAVSRGHVLERLYGKPVTAGIIEVARALTKMHLDDPGNQLIKAVVGGGAALFVTGPMPAAAVKEVVTGTFSLWPAREAPRPTRVARIPSPEQRMNVILADSPIAFFFMAMPAPEPGADDRPAAQVLAAILGGDVTSGVTRVVRDAAAGYFAEGEIVEHDGGSSLLVATAVDRWRLRKTVIQVLDALEKLSSEPPAIIDVRAARRRLLARRTAAMETGHEAALWFASAWLRGRTPEQAWEDVDRVESVEPQQIQALAHRIWKKREYAFVAVVDYNVGSGLGTVGAGEVTYWRPNRW